MPMTCLLSQTKVLSYPQSCEVTRAKGSALSAGDCSCGFSASVKPRNILINSSVDVPSECERTAQEELECRRPAGYRAPVCGSQCCSSIIYNLQTFRRTSAARPNSTFGLNRFPGEPFIDFSVVSLLNNVTLLWQTISLSDQSTLGVNMASVNSFLMACVQIICFIAA